MILVVLIVNSIYLCVSLKETKSGETTMIGTDGPTANDSLRPVRSPLMRLLRCARFTTAFVGTIPWLAVITLTVFAALGSGASRADYIALFNGPHTTSPRVVSSLPQLPLRPPLYPVVPSGQSPRRRVLPTPLPTATLSPGPSCGRRWRSGRKPPAGCRLSC